MINEIKKLLVPYNLNSLKRYGGLYDGGYIFSPIAIVISLILT